MTSSALVALVAFAAARSAAAEPPDWTRGESRLHPPAFFVVGVGTAADREAAELRARAAVAAVFSTTIGAVSRVSEVEGRSGAGVAAEQTVAQDIQATTSHVLEGVEIAEVWTDPGGSRVFALAVLDRHRAERALREQLEALAAEAAAARHEMDRVEPRLRRAVAAVRITKLERRREPLVSHLRVVGSAPPPEWPVDAAARSEVSRALRALIVCVRVDGEAAADVRSGAERALAEHGLHVAGGCDGADLVVDGTTSVVAAPGDPPWRFSRAVASIAVRDARSGGTLAKLEESAREASAREAEAARRACESLRRRVEERLSEALDAALAAP